MKSEDDKQRETHQARILVIDDNSKILDVFTRVLERDGHKVVSTESSEMALHLYNDIRQEIDLVIVDTRMPGLDGLELAREVRKMSPGVSILFRSSRLCGDLRTPDNSSVLNVPFTSADLRNKVELLLRGQ